jgi:hypothetical protein
MKIPINALNPTISAPSQFLAPYDIKPNIILIRENPTFKKNPPYTNPTTNDAYTMDVRNTNIQIEDAGKRTLNTLALSAASFIGVPQLAQIPNSLLDLSNKNSIYREYATSPINQLNDIPGIKYQDFRLRKGSFTGNFATVLSKRLDGVAAATRRSVTAITYASLSATVGAYSVFNRDGIGTFGYGWGDHDNPYAIRNDFTLSSHVTTTWVRSKTRKDKTTGDKKLKPGRWIPTLNPLELAIPFRGDRVSVIDFGQRTYAEAYLWKPAMFAGTTWLGRTLNKSGVTQDFIKFLITGPKLSPSNMNSTTVEDDIFAFRASNLSVDDSFQASYTAIQMIGRADPNYHYNGFSRDVSISFTVYATDRDELKPIWRKLNYLASYTAPIYDGQQLGLTAPWVRLTLGDIFVQQPALISSVNYTLIDSDTPMEINIEKDPQMMQVPHGVKVTLQMYMISDSLPQKGGRMYTLAKRFDNNSVPLEGNHNWLSDAKNTAVRPKTASALKENSSNKSVTDKVVTSNTDASQTNVSTGGETAAIAQKTLQALSIVQR